MGAAQFKDFTPENISQNYDTVAKKIQQMKTASPAQLTGQVNLKPLSQDKITISNLTKDEISKLMQFLRPKVPESVAIQQTQTQIKFNLIAPQALGTQEPEIKDAASTAVKQAKQAAKQAKDALAQAKLAVGENPVTLIPTEISSKSFADKCKVFEQNHKINPFNKKRVGKYMKPNGYTETLLTNLCKDPKGFCSSKKANKFITNKYCKDIDVSGVVVKQQVKQVQQQVKQVQQQVKQVQQQQVKQAQQQQQVKQAQQQQQQQQVKQAQQQVKQVQQQQVKQAQQQQVQQQVIQVTPSTEDLLNDYYLQKCNAFKANRSKNPFNKSNKGRHMVPTKYTQKLLDELCAGPPAFCNKHKGSKRISNKYCTEAPTVTQLKKDVSQQIQQIQQMVQQQQIPQVQQVQQVRQRQQQQQARQQQVRQQQAQQQVQQQIKQAQQQQLAEEEEDSAEIFIPQQPQTQSVEQSVASLFEKAQWTEKCAQYAANPNKNPFNKTNRGKHFKPNNYTTHILDELCANPTAYCDKKKGNKYISNKYCNL